MSFKGKLNDGCNCNTHNFYLCQASIYAMVSLTGSEAGRGATPMSMEIYVLSDRSLASTTEWQGAIKAAGFPLMLPAGRLLSTLSGFLPVRVSDIATGFECTCDDPGGIADTYPDAGIDRVWRHCLAFRWGTDLRALLAANMAAAAYAAATCGVVFDCEEGRSLHPQEALRMARDIEAQLPAVERMLRAAIEKLRP